MSVFVDTSFSTIHIIDIKYNPSQLKIVHDFWHVLIKNYHGSQTGVWEPWCLFKRLCGMSFEEYIHLWNKKVFQ